MKKLPLIKGSDGRFILTKDAVSVIKKAVRLTVSYNQLVKSECYFMADQEVKFGDDTLDLSYVLPINVLEQQYQFRTSVSCSSRHPLQELIKFGSTIVFIPSISEDVQHTIRYMINTNGKIISGIFEQKIYKPGTNIVMINKISEL